MQPWTSAWQNRSLVRAESRAALGLEGLTANERRGNFCVSASDSPAMAVLVWTVPASMCTVTTAWCGTDTIGR